MPPFPNEEEIIKQLLLLSLPYSPRNTDFLTLQAIYLFNSFKNDLIPFYHFSWWRLAVFNWIYNRIRHLRKRRYKELRQEITLVYNRLQQTLPNKESYPILSPKRITGLKSEILAVSALIFTCSPDEDENVYIATPVQDICGIDYWFTRRNKSPIPISVKTVYETEAEIATVKNLKIHLPSASTPTRMITLSGIEIRANPENKESLPILIERLKKNSHHSTGK